MRVKLGASPAGWADAVLPEQCLDEARQAGFSGVELGRGFPAVSGALAPLLERFGLELISGCHRTALLSRDVEAELAAMGPHLDLLEDMGCRLVIVGEGSGAVDGDARVPLSHRPVMADADWAEFGRRLTRLGEATAERGLVLAYQHRMGTVVQSSAEIDTLMDETGRAVKLLLDTGHASFAGADPVVLARRHARRIGHVHCSDVRMQVMQGCLARDASYPEAVAAGLFTVPGDGAVDFAGVFAGIHDYEGWLVVAAEQDPAKAEPLRYAALGRETLARLVRGEAAPALH